MKLTPGRSPKFMRLSDIGPYRPWYQFGHRSPVILVARLRNKWQPAFRARMAYQRVVRGHSDEELWNLNHSVAKLVVAGTSGMLEWGHGYPGELDSVEEWNEILTKIRDGFQVYLDDDWLLDPAKAAKFQEGMDLFAKWFGGLWD